MAVREFAVEIMRPSTGYTDASDRLTSEERDLLTRARQEDLAAPGFVFADSAHLDAVNYVRVHRTELDEAVRSEFGKYVADKFARSYGAAAVESGCIVPCVAE